MKQVKNMLIQWAHTGKISMNTFRRALQECDMMEPFEDGDPQALATLIVNTIS